MRTVNLSGGGGSTRYMTISYGNLVETFNQFPADMEDKGYTIHERRKTKGKAKNSIVYYIEHSEDVPVGIITNVYIRETEFGEDIVVKMDCDGEYVSISFGLLSQYASSFMCRYPNLDLHTPSCLKPYDFQNDRGKDVRGITLYQEDFETSRMKKVAPYFVSDNYEGGGNVEYLPPPDGDGSQKEDYQVIEDFLIAKFEKMIQNDFPDERENSNASRNDDRREDSRGNGSGRNESRRGREDDRREDSRREDRGRNESRGDRGRENNRREDSRRGRDERTRDSRNRSREDDRSVGGRGEDDRRDSRRSSSSDRGRNESRRGREDDRREDSRRGDRGRNEERGERRREDSRRGRDADRDQVSRLDDDQHDGQFEEDDLPF